MINRLKGSISMTLIEVLIAMLIISTSAIGVLGSFSYAYRYIRRAGAKVEAMNYCRKVQEALRAIWLVDPADSRLDAASGVRVSPPLPSPAPTPPLIFLIPSTTYDRVIEYNVTNVFIGSSGTKQISVIVKEWDALYVS